MAVVVLVGVIILSRNGQPPFPHQQGPEDTVYISENETVRLLMKFGPHRGKYMVHRHNVPYEGHDMMHRLSVGLPTTVTNGQIYTTEAYDDESDPISGR